MRQRVTQIDLLKGLAIIGVMAQHAFAPELRRRSWDALHIDQAVPVFFVLLGLNAAASLRRSGGQRLRELYSRRYLSGRFTRLLVPFLVIWPVSALVGALTGRFHIGPLMLVGVLPVDTAPGNYFITILFEFALVFPLVYAGLLRWPVATTALLIGLDVAFDLVAPHIHALKATGAGHYAYDAAILKYNLHILAGFWLGRLSLRRWLGLLTPAAAVGAAYLVALHLHPAWFNWVSMSFSRTTNFISAPYAVWLTVLGLLALPRHEARPYTALLGGLGRASYHIFLVQMIWMGVLGDEPPAGALAGMLACCVLGYIFYRAQEHGMPGLRRQVPGRSGRISWMAAEPTASPEIAERRLHETPP